jgi:hypothetical protein
MFNAHMRVRRLRTQRCKYVGETSRRTALALRFLLLSPLFCFGSSFSQIHIRDTVEIRQSGQIGIWPTKTPPPDLFIIAPRNGMLKFSGSNGNGYGYQRLWVGGPPEIVLGQTVDIIKGTKIFTRQFSPIVSSWTTGTDFSTATDVCREVFDWLYTGSLNLGKAYFAPVHAGDTLRFVVHAVYPCLAREINLLSSDPPVWSMTMWPEAHCLDFTYDERVDQFIEYADTAVRFTRPDSTNVYPTYVSHNDTTTKRNYVDLQLHVAWEDSAIRNYQVQVQRPTLIDSGGHSHGGNRPMGRYIIPRIPGPGVDTVDTFTRRTDSTGTLRFTFLASQFGGVEQIKARLVSDTTRFDTLSLITIVKGLSRLVDNSSRFDLVGGTCQHHGPGSPAGCSQTPDNNHYTAQIVRDSLPLIANAWVDSLGQTMLFINDMSLPYGGLFDISGQWRPSHAEHREGLDADIRTEIHGVRVGVKVRDASGKWKGNAAFESLARAYGVKKADGHFKGTMLEHYHLDY